MVLINDGKSSRSCLKITAASRSEEHTSEPQSRLHLVCRLLLEKKKSPPRSANDYPPAPPATVRSIAAPHPSTNPRTPHATPSARRTPPTHRCARTLSRIPATA